MKHVSVFLLFFLPTVVISQNNLGFEMKIGPNTTIISDGHSTASTGYDINVGFFMPSKNERFDWSIGLIHSKSTTTEQFHDGNAVNPDVPASADVSYFSNDKNNYFMSLPIGMRFTLNEGKHGFFIENTIGPSLLLLKTILQEYHYKSSPDYTLNYVASKGTKLLRIRAAFSLGWETALNNRVSATVAPSVSYTFFEALSVSPLENVNRPFIILGIMGGLKFGTE